MQRHDPLVVLLPKLVLRLDLVFAPAYEHGGKRLPATLLLYDRLMILLQIVVVQLFDQIRLYFLKSLQGFLELQIISSDEIIASETGSPVDDEAVALDLEPTVASLIMVPDDKRHKAVAKCKVLLEEHPVVVLRVKSMSLRQVKVGLGKGPIGISGQLDLLVRVRNGAVSALCDVDVAQVVEEHLCVLPYIVAR